MEVCKKPKDLYSCCGVNVCMTNIDIDNGLYKEWVEFHKKHDPIIYPTLRAFTALKLREIVKRGVKPDEKKKGDINEGTQQS